MVGYLERIGTLLRGLLPFQRAVVYDDAHFTVADQPDTPIVGSTGAEGAVTGYSLVQLAASIVSTFPVYGSGSTTGSSSAVILSLPIGSAAVFSYELVATDGTYLAGWQSTPVPIAWTIGTPGVHADDAATDGTFPIAPEIEVSMVGDAITITARGPRANIVGVETSGSDVIVTVGDAVLGSALTGTGVTITGTHASSGASAIEGAHAGASIEAVTATAFKILGATNDWVSGGVVMLTTPPVIVWNGWIRATVVKA